MKLFDQVRWMSLYTSGIKYVYRLPSRFSLVWETRERKELLALRMVLPLVIIKAQGSGTKISSYSGISSFKMILKNNSKPYLNSFSSSSYLMAYRAYSARNAEIAREINNISLRNFVLPSKEVINSQNFRISANMSANCVWKACNSSCAFR